MILALSAVASPAQEVHVSQSQGHVVLSVVAQQSYQLMMGEAKRPILSVECAQKGKKTGHVVTLRLGTPLAEDNDKTGLQILTVSIDGHSHDTTWMAYRDSVTFAYFGKTEPERFAFIQLLEASKTVAIEFKPFLTGMPVTSVFQIDKLRDEISKHPECVAIIK